MATNYPGSLDTGTEQPSPLSTTEMDDAGFEHDVVHTNHSGAIIALETKVGTGSSTAVADSVLAGTGAGTSSWTTAPSLTGLTINGNAVGESETDWTPSFSTGVTVGDGTVSGTYQRVNDFIVVQGSFVLGSTSAITGDVRVDLPVAAQGSFELSVGTTCMLRDQSAGREYQGAALTYSGSEVRLRVLKRDTGNNFVFAAAISSTNPMTWATGDRIQWTQIYRVGS